MGREGLRVLSLLSIKGREGVFKILLRSYRLRKKEVSGSESGSKKWTQRSKWECVRDFAHCYLLVWLRRRGGGEAPREITSQKQNFNCETLWLILVE